MFYGRCYCHVYWQMLWPILWRDVKPHIVWTICNKCRLMLLPVADGVAAAGWHINVADVIAQGLTSKLSSEVLNRTSSHMCGRWNLPIFLLRDGLLTLMYSASLIALLRFWSSLPTMLKFWMVTWWPVMLLWSNIGEGAFWCSLNLSPNALEDSPMYSSSQSTLPHLYL